MMLFLKWTYCQYPVLFLPPTDQETNVEDADLGRLHRGRAAFQLFACRALKGQDANCTENLYIHVRSSTVSMRLATIDETKNFSRVPVRATVKVSDVNDQQLVERSITIRPSWVRVQLVLENREDPVVVVATVGNRSTVPLVIIVDDAPPKIDLRTMVPVGKDDREFLWVSVRTSKMTVPTKMLTRNDCEEDFPSDRFESYTVADLVRFRCSSVPISSSFLNAIEVLGGTEVVKKSLGNDAALRIALLAGVQSDIVVSVAAGALSDLVGNVDPVGASLFYHHRPIVGRPSIDRRIRLLQRDIDFNRSYSSSGTSGAFVGYVVTGVAGGTLASSAASGGSSGHPGENLPIFLLNIVQKLYLSGNIAVSDMPDLYADFANQLSWAMFNFPSPFETFVKKSDKRGMMLDDPSTDGDSDDETSYWVGIEGAYIYMSRVFFWVPLGLLSLLFIHGLVLLFCIWKKTRIPVIFAFPRLEILYLYWGMPAIAVASAGLFRGSKVDATIAVWLLVMLPGAMAVWNIMMLNKFFYSKHPRDRHANFVVQSMCLSARSLDQLKRDWNLRSKIKEERKHPPMIFINGLYDDLDPDDPRQEEKNSVNGRRSFSDDGREICQQFSNRDGQTEEISTCSSHHRQRSIGKEMSSVCNSPSPDVPHWTFRMNSQGSSANNMNFTTSGEDHTTHQTVHMRKMSDFELPKKHGVLWERDLLERSPGTKYGTDRFRNETSNNIVSLMQPDVFSELEIVPLPSPADTYGREATDEGPSRWFDRSSPDRPEWMRQKTACSDVPMPVWNVFLSKEHQTKIPETKHDNCRPKELEVHRLSRISEISSGGSNLRETRTSRSGLHGGRMQFIDNQLGITVMVPEPFVETGARLKHINNECLLDMGLDHLIASDSDSGDEDKSEIEYQLMMHRSLLRTPSLSCCGIFKDLFDLGIFSIFMGGRQLKGDWILSPYQDNNFISSYGYLFEDYHGLPVFYREPTYEIIDGKMDRGKFIPLREPPLSSFPKRRIPWTTIEVPSCTLYRHHIQILTRFLLLTKIILLGAMVAGVGSGSDSLGQIIVLFVASLFLLVTLRIARPYPTRFEMMISMTEETSDVMFLSLAMLLLIGPRSDDFRLKIGIGMIAVECSSFVAVITDRLLHSYTGFGLMLQRRRARKPTKLTYLFFRYLSKNRYFLQRKYFDRWMVKTLKRGLYNRRPYRTELPMSYLLSCQMQKIRSSLTWLKEECRRVGDDFKKLFGSTDNKRNF